MKKSLKKIFQIVRYDFKRLMLNPITLVGLSIVLAIVLITGLVYKIPTTPVYSATTKGETTKSIYNNFLVADSSYDSKEKLTLILNGAKKYLEVQTDSDSELQDLQLINETYCKGNDGDLLAQVEYYGVYHSCEYTTNNDISEFSDFSDALYTFVAKYSNLKPFESKLLFTTEQFETLKNIESTFSTISMSGKSVSGKMDDLLKNKKLFYSFKYIVSSINDLEVHTDILKDFEATYIKAAEDKLKLIEKQMKELNDLSPTSQDTTYVSEMRNYITSYKKVCESARDGIYNELCAIVYKLPNHNKLYGYNLENNQIIQQNIVEAKFYINDSSLEFKQYQTPLNFGSASTKVTPFDHSNMVISIVGFMNIIFGIFCAYKLFGKDRKSGKLDLLLSQKVKFSEVFVAKFFAIFLSTGTILLGFTILSMIWGSILYKFLPNSIFAVFNLKAGYTIHPLIFLIIKMLGIQLQIVFWVVITIFMMNISRRFLQNFFITIGIFLIATIGNIFLNGQIWYCLLPFIHTDLTAYIGGATMQTGLFRSSLYAYGNFFISLIYYWVIVVLIFNFTRNLFKKN